MFLHGYNSTTPMTWNRNLFFLLTVHIEKGNFKFELMDKVYRKASATQR